MIEEKISDPSTRRKNKRLEYEGLPVAKRVRHVKPPNPLIDLHSRIVLTRENTTELYPIRGFRNWFATPWHGGNGWAGWDWVTRTFVTRTSIISIRMVFRGSVLSCGSVDVYRFRSASGRDGPAILVHYSLKRHYHTYASVSIRTKRSKDRLHMSKVLSQTPKGLGFPIVKGFERLAFVCNSTDQTPRFERWNMLPVRESPTSDWASSRQLRLRFKYFYLWRSYVSRKAWSRQSDMICS